jgi:flagellar biosynthesis protein FlhG
MTTRTAPRPLPRQARPADQASRLRAMVAAAQAEPPAIGSRVRHVPVVAIASGKGGVGKTNLAVNLSIAMARAGRRVTLLDADLGMANADVLCGLAPGRRLDAVLRTGSDTDLASCVVEAPGGFLLVPGAVGVARVADLDTHARRRLLAQVEGLEARSDAILIDTGAGVGPDVLNFACAADILITVVTPEPTSITDAYGLLKCIHARPEAAAAPMLVVNGVGSGAEARRVAARISNASQRFLGRATPLLGWVRRDERVPRAVRNRTPHLLAFPRSRASRDVQRLAASLGEALGSRRSG